MNGTVASTLAIMLAILAAGAPSALGEGEFAEQTSRKTERPTNLDRPIGVKPYFLSPAPDRLAPSDEQRAIDYRSRLEGEIKRRERRPSARRGRRGFDRMQSLRRERARIGRMIRR